MYGIPSHCCGFETAVVQLAPGDSSYIDNQRFGDRPCNNGMRVVARCTAATAHGHRLDEATARGAIGKFHEV
jgi:hypothetical protein